MRLLHTQGHCTILVIVVHRLHSLVGQLVASSFGSLHGTFCTMKAGPQGGRLQIRSSSGPLGPVSKVHVSSTIGTCLLSLGGTTQGNSNTCDIMGVFWTTRTSKSKVGFSCLVLGSCKVSPDGKISLKLYMYIQTYMYISIFSRQQQQLLIPLTFSDIHTIIFTFFHFMSLIKASLFSSFPFQITAPCYILLLSPSSQWTLSSFLCFPMLYIHIYSRCRSAAWPCTRSAWCTDLCIAEVTCVGLLLGEMYLKFLHANISTILTP